MTGDVEARHGAGARIEEMYSAQAIADRVAALGREISKDYEDRTPIHVIGVLKGCFTFVADLVRAVELETTLDFLGLSSYGASTKSSGVVRMTQDLSVPIEGRHVLIVEDIVDTGLTMNYLIENLRTRQPASLAVCTLLHKPENQELEVPLEYVGFTIPNSFVIGYGLDYAEVYRNLPYIGRVVHD